MMKYIVLILSLFFSVAGFGQGQMFLRSTPAGGSPANLLLDDYPGAAAAYAVMKLDNDYVGSCLRVRRDSDNTEQDIGFSGNDIDEASINSFCSGANCFVKTWYDQSGNGNNATQTTTANQPKIYDSVTGIIYENSVATLKFDGTDDYLTSGVTATQPNTFFILHKKITHTLSYLFDASIGSRQVQTDDSRIFAGVNLLNAYPASELNTQKIFVAKIDGASTSTWFNGTLAVTGNAGTNSLGSLNIGASNANTNTLDGNIQAFILYDSDQSANRTGIETIINNYFSIY